MLPISVCGGGLAGCMLALLLARRGLPVRVIEFRKDADKAQREAPQVEEKVHTRCAVHADQCRLHLVN